MTIDATFWVSISFFIFIGVLIYLKVPQKINLSLINKINEIKNELDEADRLKEESKKLLNNYEEKISKSQKESKNIINEAKKISENMILEKMKKFHEVAEERKKNTEQNKKDKEAIPADIMIEKASISPRLATFTLVHVLKGQGLYQRALDVLDILDQKGENKKQIEVERQSIQSLL